MVQTRQIFTTTDYSLFKSLDGNRSLNLLHVKKLKQSFLIAYLFSPILVNKHFQIIDGQHRAQAAKELALEIHYIIVEDYGLREVQILNTNTNNWEKKDYLKGYCDLNYPNYILFNQFLELYPDFGIGTAEILFTQRLGEKNQILEGTQTAGRSFVNGNLTVPDYNLSCKQADMILNIKPYYVGYNRRNFVTAMVGIFRLPQYNHEQLLKRLKATPNVLQDCTTIAKFKLMIEEVYNYKSKHKVSLRY